MCVFWNVNVNKCLFDSLPASLSLPRSLAPSLAPSLPSSIPPVKLKYNKSRPNAKGLVTEGARGVKDGFMEETVWERATASVDKEIDRQRSLTRQTWRLLSCQYLAMFLEPFTLFCNIGLHRPLERQQVTWYLIQHVSRNHRHPDLQSDPTLMRRLSP